MRLSTKSRFAVTAMIEIGLSDHAGRVSLATISQRHHISISYLEQIFKNLRVHGLVDSTRGPGGGYTLNRQAHQISVADIINATHSDEELAHAHGQTESNTYLATEELWSTLNQKLDDHMRAISLHSLIASELAKGARAAVNHSPKRGVFAQPVKSTTQVKAPNSVFALGQALT